MSNGKIRIVLADDHAVVRSGVRGIAAAAGDIEVVGDAPDGRTLLDVVARTHPDVVVMDLGMARLDGLEAARELAARQPAPRILVLTMHPAEEYLLEALDAGASGYLVKSAAEHELVDAIRALAAGEMYVQPRAARVLSGRAAPDGPGADDRTRLSALTDRERSVLTLIAEGHTASRIAGRLAISKKTVDTYKQRISAKLGVTGRPGFVSFALRVGLLGAPQPARRRFL